MIDVLMIFIALISLIISALGFIHLNKQKNSENDEKILQLIREEKIVSYNKSNRKRKSILNKIKKINTENEKVIYQSARKNRLSVGEILLATKINSMK
jgi:hypothetical protein